MKTEAELSRELQSERWPRWVRILFGMMVVLAYSAWIGMMIVTWGDGKILQASSYAVFLVCIAIVVLIKFRKTRA